MTTFLLPNSRAWRTTERALDSGVAPTPKSASPWWNLMECVSNGLWNFYSTREYSLDAWCSGCVGVDGVPGLP